MTTDEKPVTKVILTRVEELMTVREQAEHGLTGRAVVEVTKNSPIEQKVVKVNRYTEYFESKFVQGGLTAEQIRDIGNKF
jgi:hypothetical protein